MMRTKLMVMVLMLSFVNLKAQNSTDDIAWNPKVNKPQKPSYSLSNNQYFSVQYMGLTFHPGGGAVKMISNYPLKFDKKAYFVLNIGLAANYDYELNKRFFLRGEASFYMDCAYKKAGYLHAALHVQTINLGKHRFNIGFGPVISVREDWHVFEDYKATDFYGERVWNGMQYRIFPLGGQIEYRYQINEDLEFQYSVIPGYPAVVTSKFGLRWKL